MARKSVVTRIIQLESLKHQREALDAEIKEVQAKIIEEMDSTEQKSIVVELDDRNIKATKVQGVRSIIDENTLKRTLGEKMWVKVSTRVLDKRKLEAYIASGEVDPMEVAECTSEKPTAPYIKLA